MKTPYLWKNVPIGGGGYVTGLAIHPLQPELVYIRTDVGGPFRWNPQQPGWIPLMDSFGLKEWNLFGIDSLALDPSDPQVVYVSAGKYYREEIRLVRSHDRNAIWREGDPEPSDVLKSTDQGKTWQRTGLNIDMGGNEHLRWAGERLAVDPHFSSKIYLGSRRDGLWLSQQAAQPGSWQRVTGFPATGEKNAGLTFVLFDSSIGSQGVPTPVLYIGAYGEGVYRSQDGGATWRLLPGSPIQPLRAAIDGQGGLFTSHEGGLAKWNGVEWLDCSPRAGERCCAISVDTQEPQVVMTAGLRYEFNNPIFRSVDGGRSWKQVQYRHHSSVPWWPEDYWSAATACLIIDPHKPRRVWFTDWFGVWRTDDITAEPSDWYTFERGHEEMVSFDLKSTPTGAILLSGVADNDGHRYTSLSGFPLANDHFRLPHLQDTTSLDFMESNPNRVVRVGERRWNNTSSGGYSDDNGQTWMEFANRPPGVQGGRIAISPSDPNRIVWLPRLQAPFYTLDGGRTWLPSTGAPEQALTGEIWAWRQPLAADRILEQTFYLYAAGTVYRSEDSGATWQAAGLLPAVEEWQLLKTAPGMAGEVWVSLDTEGLWRSSTKAGIFQKLPGVERAYLFAFGQSPTDRPYPTVFVYGTIDRCDGIFRSDDFGETWFRIDAFNPAIGNDPLVMEGDRQVRGRVYIGTFGRGIFYGEPYKMRVMEIS